MPRKILVEASLPPSPPSPHRPPHGPGQHGTHMESGGEGAEDVAIHPPLGCPNGPGHHGSPADNPHKSMHRGGPGRRMYRPARSPPPPPPRVPTSSPWTYVRRGQRRYGGPRTSGRFSVRRSEEPHAWTPSLSSLSLERASNAQDVKEADVPQPQLTRRRGGSMTRKRRDHIVEDHGRHGRVPAHPAHFHGCQQQQLEVY